MDQVIYRDYIVNRRFFLFTVVWPVDELESNWLRAQGRVPDKTFMLPSCRLEQSPQLLEYGPLLSLNLRDLGSLRYLTWSLNWAQEINARSGGQRSLLARNNCQCSLSSTTRQGRFVRNFRRRGGAGRTEGRLLTKDKV